MNQASDSDRAPPVVSGDGRAPAVRALLGVAGTLAFCQFVLFAPGDLAAAFGFSTRDLGSRWWTVLTFTLVHGNLWTFAANAVVLVALGAPLERAWGTAAFIRLYAVTALAAWITHALIAPSGAVLSGMAAPALGAAFAMAALAGGTHLVRVGLLALSGGAVVISAAAIVLLAGALTDPVESSAAYLVHAAGFMAGWVYLRIASSLDLSRLRDGVSPVPDESDDEPPRVTPKSARTRSPRPEDDIVARSNAAVAREAARRTGDAALRGPVLADEARLNQLLDKISSTGIDSLTADERRMLEELSRHRRDD